MSIATAENYWVNTIDSRKPEVLDRARRIVESNVYCTLSTCSSDGFPWASPVFFAYDQRWSIYWSSATISRHSQNIYNNYGRAAIAIYSTDVPQGSAQGLFFSGTAAEVEPEDVSSTMQLLFKRVKGNVPDRTDADYLAPSPRRFYRFHPTEVWITGERLAIANQLVDTKIQLSLRDLLEED